MNQTPSRSQPALTLDMAAAERLAAASRLAGQVEALGLMWPWWESFALGPLAAAGAVAEAGLLGYQADLAELLALGPEPNPSRPKKGLRLAVGLTLAARKLKSVPPDRPLTPVLVTEIFQGIDAPHLARSKAPAARTEPAGPVEGSAVWTLAGRWIAGGLPPLWAAGLALASWEREGPEHRMRSLTGRVLLGGLAPRLGIPSAALVFLGPALAEAAQGHFRSWTALLKKVRGEGAWRSFLQVFLAAAELAARRAMEAALKVQALRESHLDLIETWVRAPRHPKQLLGLFLARPVLDLPLVSAELKVTQRTAGLLVDKLKEQGLIAETTGQRRGRRFAYAPLIDILQPGWSEAPKKE